MNAQVGWEALAKREKLAHDESRSMRAPGSYVQQVRRIYIESTYAWNAHFPQQNVFEWKTPSDN
jgi:hypothetical protein